VKTVSAALALLLAAGAAAQAPPTIEASELSRHVKMLASDEFEGRAPGTEGERRTIAYLAEQFAAAGAQPGGENGGWTQAVRMSRYRVAGTPEISLSGDGECGFDLGDATTIWTRNAAPRVEIAGAPLVFGGYGVHAPSLGWDDYGDLDLTGKVVVLLANDPDHEAETGPFGGPALSFFGRPGSKIEEAGRRGALGVLIVHHDEYLGMPWDFSRGAYSMPANALAGSDDGRVAFSSWLRLDAAERLFGCAGLELESERKAAQRQGFKARALPGLGLSARFDVEVEETVTHNVIARIRGSRHPDETFIYTAHWDHMGIGRADSAGDTIYNGAMDNAGGVAGLIELARVFAAGPRPERSIVFIATTLEENGLLGAEYYARNPIYPLETTVGGINMDAVNLFGPTGTMEVTGLGKTTLERYLEEELTATGRRMQDDPNSVVGFYFRSDHFPFVRRGVPFVFAGSGWELAPEKAPNTRDPQVGTRFHQPSDEWVPELDFEAAARDIRLYHRVGSRLANSRDWPGWTSAGEFRHLREPSAAARR
jgi:Zn-dependent M28 family amino/carboxypeptidase